MEFSIVGRPRSRHPERASVLSSAVEIGISMQPVAENSPVRSVRQMSHLDQLLRLMTDRKASDLHLRPMRPPLLRINGKLMAVDSEPLRPAELEEKGDGVWRLHAFNETFFLRA